VVHPDGRWAIALEPNAALGKGGTGDVLTGILGALLAQGLAPWQAARLAVAVHAEAGRELRQRFGTRAGLASDLVQCLAEAWRVLER
jgi:NAD(P)H-hydrate repair Nnr-like enzyme with NAD(P)H-hydrate dehydratase domain